MKAIEGLPHRPPFVFIDEVARAGGGICLATKTFHAADPVFAGHFPGDPIVPGVLLAEATAQAAGLAVGEGAYLLSAIRNMKFPSTARPGERICIEAEAAGELDGHLLFDVRALVGERIVAEGRVVLSRRDPHVVAAL
jgi:3-hydroxyacyl-[acyl-carrier-protein] dehydratase